MSQTVSFVVREDLAEWLESRADEEMKTVSSVVQDIVAAEYRRQQGESQGDSDGQGENEGESSVDAEEMLVRHSEAWYSPESAKNNYAVRHPGDKDTRYYKTKEGAASRIRRWYEGEDTDGRQV